MPAISRPPRPEPDFIAQVVALTDRLRVLDKRLVVFGARHHGYAFNAPLPLERVEALERPHDLTLPFAPRLLELYEYWLGGDDDFWSLEATPGT